MSTHISGHEWHLACSKDMSTRMPTHMPAHMSTRMRPLGLRNKCMCGHVSESRRRPSASWQCACVRSGNVYTDVHGCMRMSPFDTGAAEVCLDMCIGMCRDMCICMCIGVCVSTCVSTCIWMCIDMDMCIDMCTDRVHTRPAARLHNCTLAYG